MPYGSYHDNVRPYGTTRPSGDDARYGVYTDFRNGPLDLSVRRDHGVLRDVERSAPLALQETRATGPPQHWRNDATVSATQRRRYLRAEAKIRTGSVPTDGRQDFYAPPVPLPSVRDVYRAPPQLPEYFHVGRPAYDYSMSPYYPPPPPAHLMFGAPLPPFPPSGPPAAFHHGRFVPPVPVLPRFPPPPPRPAKRRPSLRPGAFDLLKIALTEAGIPSCSSASPGFVPTTSPDLVPTVEDGIPLPATSPISPASESISVSTESMDVSPLSTSSSAPMETSPSRDELGDGLDLVPSVFSTPSSPRPSGHSVVETADCVDLPIRPDVHDRGLGNPAHATANESAGDSPGFNCLLDAMAELDVLLDTFPVATNTDPRDNPDMLDP